MILPILLSLFLVCFVFIAYDGITNIVVVVVVNADTVVVVVVVVNDITNIVVLIYD